MVQLEKEPSTQRWHCLPTNDNGSKRNRVQLLSDILYCPIFKSQFI